MVPFGQLEVVLQKKLENVKEPTVSLHCDRTVPVDEVVKVMNIAKNNKYKLILATSPK
jgi:biopolymer transport protein ExbD